MHDYPQPIVPVNHIAPVPRRIRATLGGRVVLDTVRALYVWEWAPYPQYYVPVADVAPGVLVDEGTVERHRRGTAQRHALRVGDIARPGAVRVYGEDALPGLPGTARFDWDALDAWFEEDERVHVHPRSPYARVDALRSTRRVRIELEGVVLAESSSPVMVFETGLPPRHYLNRNEVDLARLIPSATETACPYKGTTSDYWSVRTGETLHDDLAWSYAFPTLALTPIAGLIAFFDERVDVFLDGELQLRPTTPFSR